MNKVLKSLAIASLILVVLVMFVIGMGVAVTQAPYIGWPLLGLLMLALFTRDVYLFITKREEEDTDDEDEDDDDDDDTPHVELTLEVHNRKNYQPAADLQPHQQRMVDEEAELYDRMDKLRKALDEEPEWFKQMPAIQQHLMRKQLVTMIAYHCVLLTRCITQGVLVRKPEPTDETKPETAE